MSSEQPSRVVDTDQNGWMSTAHEPGGPTVYTINHDQYLTLDELRVQHGPIRPVEPMTDADAITLRDTYEQAGRKAVYSLAVAIYRTLVRARNDHGGLDRPIRSYDSAVRQLRAGRPGSWQSHQLIAVALWAGDGRSSRIHASAAKTLQAILYRWVTDPDRYTEVAENLAATVSMYADAHDHGWAAVADGCLQAGSPDDDGVQLTYGLFYSVGRDFDPVVIR